MKRLLLISLFLSMLVVAQSWAQSRTVSGKVTGDDGSGIPGVNVVVQGTAVGTATDIDGNYKLSMPEGATMLKFSAIGYKSQEVTVGARSTVDITLSEEVLTEVVVTALGITREERSLGYAVQKVDGEELTKARETNIVNSLQGKVAGVQITGASGNLGGSSRILIRGASSITGQNQPLFVIDGVPIDNSNFTSTAQASGAGGYDYGNAAQDINPDDIANISILKGPSAAALYGTRASNGVILITTKSGKKGGKGVGVSVNSGVTFENILILPEYQNKYGGGNGPFNMNDDGEYIVNYAKDGSWGPKFSGQEVRHWDSYDEWDTENFGQTRPWVASPHDVDEYFETGVSVRNNVAFSGANDRGNFRLSYTNVYQKGNQPNSNLKRNTLNLNAALNLTDKLTTSASINYVSSRAAGRPGTGYDENNVMQGFNQWWQRQLDMSRLKNYKNPDGSQRTWNRNSATDPSPNYFDNPYWTRYENYQNDGRERLFGNIAITYKFFDWLKLTGRVMSDLYTDRREERNAVGSVLQPRYREGLRTVKEINSDLILEFNKNITEDFSLNAIVGGNIRYNNYYRNVTTTAGGLNVPNFYNLSNSTSAILTIDDYLEEKQINSLFANASLGYKGTLYLDLTLRNDWSSTLPLNNNRYLYPSTTVSFVFTELAPLQNMTWLSFGKLRAGWAQVGNDTDPYRLYTTYAPEVNFGANPLYTVPNSRNNPSLKPEITTSWEVGLEARFLQNRAFLDVTYYSQTTRDQIIPVTTTAATGYSRQVVNAGVMSNSGVELVLGGSPIKTVGGFEWQISVNWARNRNKVVELAEGISNLQLSSLFGVSVNATEGEAYGAMLGYDFVYDADGNKIVKTNGYYARTSTIVPLGSVLADWTGGISNTISYKGLSFNFLVDMQSGGTMFSLSNMWGKYSGVLAETAEGNIRETGVIADGVVQSLDNEGDPITDDNGNVVSDGTPNTTVISAQDHFNFNQGYEVNAADVYDASYIKLREAKIGYTLPNKLMGDLPLRDVSFYIVGRNLALLYSNVPHLDPESGISTSNVQGIEGAQVPSLRSWGFNLSFRF